MSFSSQKNIPSNNPPANKLASQSTQQPQPVCTWSAHAPKSGPSPSPFPRHSHALTAIATAAGELFLFGGQVHGLESCDLYVFSTRDFSTALLQTSGEVPTPRYVPGAALIGTTLLIYGGAKRAESVPNHDSLYLLNLVSGEWSRVVVDGPGPGGRYQHTTTVVGSKLFVFGGQVDGEITNDMWTLDLNCLKSQPLWESYEPTPGNEKPLPRSAHVSVTTKDRIIIFSGYSGPHLYSDTWSFDISTRKWTELQCTGSIPSPRYCHAAVLVDDVMYVFGGYSPSEGFVNDLYALQLSTQRWFQIHNMGPSPYRRGYHAMASDGTRVFVLGGRSLDSRADKLSLIHVFDTKDIKYPEPEHNAVNPNELEKQLSVSLAVQTERGYRIRIAQLTNELALKSALLKQAEENAAGRILMQTSLAEHRGAELVDMQAKLRNTEAKLDELVVSYDQQVGQYESVRAKFEAKESELKAVRLRLAFAEKGRTSLDELVVSRDRQVGQYEKELGNVRAKLEANESELEAVRLRLANAEKGRTSLDELVVSRDRQVGQYEEELGNVRAKLEANESELEAVRLRLADAEKGWTSLDVLVASRDQQVKQYEKELTNVRAKLEAKESELEAVRLRFTDAEKGLTKSKAEADTLQRARNATGSVNRDVDEVTLRLLERMRALEVEVASKRWKEKSIGEMECRNEKSIDEMDYRNEG